MEEINSPLPFDGDNSVGQKFFNVSNNLSLLGLPNSYSGVDKKNNFAWNKRGVSLAYMTIPTLKSAVDVIATNLSSVPMVLKDSKGNIVHRSDNSGASNNDFLNAIERSYKYYGLPIMELWATSILLYGENYIEKVPNTADQYIGLKWLNPLGMSIETQLVEDYSGLIIGSKKRVYEQKTYRYSGRFGQAEYQEDEILFSRKFNPLDDIHGYSDALSALGKANITMEFDTFTLAFYDNNGHPGVIISPRDKLVNERQVVNWQKEWQNKFAGSQQQFKTHISAFPFDVQTFDMLDISKPMEVSEKAEQKILRALKVPPEMIGDTTENSYQFSKESKNSFMQTVVRPLGLSVSNAINHSGIIDEFSSNDNGLKFGFDFSEFESVAKTDLDKQDVLERRVKSGGISLGQYQRSLNAEVQNGADDVFMIPQGFVLIDKEKFKEPEEIVVKDQTGPDASSLNQSERETQSETEDQESTEFFSSKSLSEDDQFIIDLLDKEEVTEEELIRAKEIQEKNGLEDIWIDKMFEKSKKSLEMESFLDDTGISLSETLEYLKKYEEEI